MLKTMTSEQSDNIYNEMLSLNKALGKTNENLATVTEKLEHVPEQTKKIAIKVAQATLKKHTEQCSKTIKLGPDTRAWLTKILIAGALFGGGASVEKVISLFGG